MKSFTLSAPAKVNLYLKVQNKRPDGFHNIKTLFERIDLCDQLTFTRNQTGQISISCNHPQVPVGPKNLIYQVAQNLQKASGTGFGAHIRLQKNIPVAAGLAGGSTNAATAILGLNRLWNLKLSNSSMLQVSRQIGSDVAFFLYDTSFAMGTERGDRIRPLKISSKMWHILVTPKTKLLAGQIYGAFKIRLTKNHDNANILIHNLRKMNIYRASQYFENDLEAAILRFCPRLLTLQKKLKSLNAKGVTISGSGPSVFGVTETKQQALNIKKALDNRYSQVFVVRTR